MSHFLRRHDPVQVQRVIDLIMPVEKKQTDYLSISQPLEGDTPIAS
jgi:hypothetical protein